LRSTGEMFSTAKLLTLSYFYRSKISQMGERHKAYTEHNGPFERSSTTNKM